MSVFYFSDNTDKNLKHKPMFYKLNFNYQNLKNGHGQIFTSATKRISCHAYFFYHSNLTFCKKNIWILISYKSEAQLTSEHFAN